MTFTRREARILGVFAALALVAPLALAQLLDSRLRGRVIPALSEALGEPVSIGDVELDLLGTLRLREVRIGARMQVAALEASVGVDSLLAGAFAADEIRVA